MILKVAIAIPTYNRDSVLINTINEVLNQEYLPDEILVLDQTKYHSQEVENKLSILSKNGKIKYIKISEPSLPRARNLALISTECDIIIFIDDDVILPKNFVNMHLQNYIDNQKIISVAGKVDQNLGWPKIKRPLNWPSVLDYKFFDLSGSNRVEGIANFFGCNHSFRRVEILNLGGYDENFLGSGLREDSDMAIRIFKAGHIIVFDPKSCLLHLAAPSGGCRKSNSYDVTASLSILWFAIKYKKLLGIYFYFEVWHSLRLALFNRKSVSEWWKFPKLTYVFFVELFKKFNTN